MIENNETPRTNEMAAMRRTVNEWSDHSEGLERDLNSTTAELAALKARLADITQPITMQGIRLHAGEGRLEPHHVLVAVNAILRNRAPAGEVGAK